MKVQKNGEQNSQKMIVWYLVVSSISYDKFSYEGVLYTILDDNNNVNVSGYYGSPTDLVLSDSFIF